MGFHEVKYFLKYGCYLAVPKFCNLYFVVYFDASQEPKKILFNQISI